MTLRVPGKATLCLLLVLLGSISQSACTYTAAVSQTNIPPPGGTAVEASVYKFIVLGFNFDNDEVFTLVDRLKDKCPQGEVRGILTKDLRTMYFLFFFWARETIARGTCIKPARVAASEVDGLTTSAALEAAQPEENETLSSDASPVP